MSKTKQAFLELQEQDLDIMDDDEYQHLSYTNQLNNLFQSFGEAINFARELEQSNPIKNEIRNL